ncbi:MAG: hypothetical protein WDN48_17210 [Pseudolabrys sp.]
MLVANRDPYRHGTPDNPSPQATGSRLARTMSALQIVGTVLAIPVGIGSAYSMYRANFLGRNHLPEPARQHRRHARPARRGIDAAYAGAPRRRDLRKDLRRRRPRRHRGVQGSAGRRENSGRRGCETG